MSSFYRKSHVKGIIGSRQTKIALICWQKHKYFCFHLLSNRRKIIPLLVPFSSDISHLLGGLSFQILGISYFRAPPYETSCVLPLESNWCVAQAVLECVLYIQRVCLARGIGAAPSGSGRATLVAHPWLRPGSL